MARTKVFNSQLQHQPSMFGAYKTANQATVTNNALTIITWNTVEEYRDSGNFDPANNKWTAPADGWFECTVTLSIIGGASADDSMNWGYYVDGTAKWTVSDNWWKNSNSTGMEFVVTVTAGFKVTAGQTVDVRYNGTANSVTLMGNACFWNGRFTPNVV